MRFRVIAAGVLAASLPGRALAHHVMDGRTPATFSEGLLSGLGHPVIELPHFAAILLVGVLAARLGAGMKPIAAFVIASFLSTLVVSVAASFPVDETLVLGSVAFLALLLAARGYRSLVVAMLFAIGLLHGAAFAEAVVGAETTPLAAYLAGLAVAEFAIAGFVFWATTKFARNRAPSE